MAQLAVSRRMRMTSFHHAVMAGRLHFNQSLRRYPMTAQAVVRDRSQRLGASGVSYIPVRVSDSCSPTQRSTTQRSVAFLLFLFVFVLFFFFGVFVRVSVLFLF